MNDNGLQDVTEKFMNEGSLFGIEFSGGIVFLEVTGWSQVKFAPYDNVGPVDSEDVSGFTRLEDGNGDDVLYVPKRENKILHTSIGMSPKNMRRYTNYPDGEVRLRRLPNPGVPNAGSDFGYVDGKDSPYSSPTDAEELMIPPGTHLDFNFYNPDNEVKEPVLNILSRVYSIRPLNPGDSGDANSINRVVSPGSPMPVHPAGSYRRKVDYDLEDHWGVRPITREEAKEV